MPLIDDLNALRDSMAVSLTSPADVELGRAVTATIVPPISGVSVTDLVPTPVNFSLVGKGVVFTNANPADPTVSGALPLIDFTTVPPSVDPGVPGVLGAVEGQLPVAVQVPLRLEVEWSVRDEGGTTLAEGTDFLAPNGLESPDVIFVFLPHVVELTTDTPSAPLVRRLLHARVRLTAALTQTSWRDLPEVPLMVPGIAVPTVLAAFLHTNFHGAMLVMVPQSSLLSGAGQIVTVLNKLESALAPISSVVRFAAFLAGIQQLSAVLASEPRIQFRQTDSIGNLNNVTLIQRSWYENDTEAEDELSSMLLIGPTDRQAECFNDRSFKTGEGKFTLTLGDELFTAVRDLNSASPASEPSGDEIVIDRSPPGGWFDPDDFGDELSSIRFAMRSVE